MGCGGSKFDLEGESVPVRIRPLLRRRFEEIKRQTRVNGLKDSTPSKKELLHNEYDGCEEDDVDHISSPRSSRGSVKVFEHNVEEKRPVKPEKDEKIEEPKSIVDSDDDDSDEEVYICPKSPSFRVYYVESLANKKDIRDQSKIIEIIKEASQSEESIASTASTEDMEVKSSEKKTKKGKRFRRVIPKVPKGGHNAVKNLLRAKSCYNPATSTHGHTRLVQKADA